MAKRGTPVRLQVLLRPEHRSEQGRTEAAAALRRLNLEVTGRGLVTISARAPWSVVAAAFGVAPGRQPHADTPDVAADLPIPDALAAHVERISIAPQHEPMAGDETPSDSERDKENQ